MTRPLRIGHQLSARIEGDPVEIALRAEALGFDIVLTMDDAASTPYLLIGTVDEIVAHMTACNERWGINHFAVRELDDFAPVLEALR